MTHSALLLPLWALAFSWILAKILREPRGWRALYGVTAMGIGLHIAGDLITSFGTLVLAPFSDWRAGIGTTFIIDLWFSGIILAGLLASAFFFRSRIPSVTAAMLLVGYVGFQYLQREKALEFAETFAREKGLRNPQISAHPKPVSPFNWTVFVSDDQVHRFSHVNLRREEVLPYAPGDGFVRRLDAAYRPLALAQWETRSRYGDRPEAREAWNSPAMAVYRWFADLPAIDGQDANCYWFVDLRFLTPGRDSMPFRYGVCGGRLVPPD